MSRRRHHSASKVRLPAWLLWIFLAAWIWAGLRLMGVLG